MALGRAILQDARAGLARMRTRPDRVQRSQTPNPPAKSASATCCASRTTAANFKWKCWLSAKCAALRRWLRSSIRRLTPAGEMRLKLAEERKAMPHFESAREGKPSKRDRREIGRLRGRL